MSSTNKQRALSVGLLGKLVDLPDHPEALSAVEHRGTGEKSDRLLASIDNVPAYQSKYACYHEIMKKHSRVNLVISGVRPHTLMDVNKIPRI